MHVECTLNEGSSSEGLDVLVLENLAPGGQAGTSSRIENYLGFPTGISGEALAGRALVQAEKFGAEVAITRRAARLDCDAKPYSIVLQNGDVVRTRAIVIATGARYRKLADNPSIVLRPRTQIEALEGTDWIDRRAARASRSARAVRWSGGWRDGLWPH
jgi:thioredoxin reductase